MGILQFLMLDYRLVPLQLRVRIDDVLAAAGLYVLSASSGPKSGPSILENVAQVNLTMNSAVVCLVQVYSEVQGLHEPLSKLLVSPLITPIVVPYIIPHITPL